MLDTLNSDELELYEEGYYDGYSQGKSEAEAIGFEHGVQNERASLSKMLTALKERFFADNKSELFYPALADPQFALKLAEIYLSEEIPETLASELALADRDSPGMRERGDDLNPTGLHVGEMEMYLLARDQELGRIMDLLHELRKRLEPEGKMELFERASADPYLANALAEIYLPNEEGLLTIPAIDAIDEKIAKLNSCREHSEDLRSFLLSFCWYDLEIYATGASCGRGRALSYLHKEICTKSSSSSEEES